METLTVAYAGFWRRFVAIIIDDLLLSAVYTMILVPVFALFGIGIGLGALTDEEGTAIGFILAALAAAAFAIFVIMIAGWLYFALMESSSRMATVGKMVIGIKVTDLDGNKISFARASGRYFGKILSGLFFCIGYIIAGFTEKKQALHDIIAGCLVVLK